MKDGEGVSELYIGVVLIVCVSSRQDAGSQQVGFLLGSCGVTLALTTDACQKGLPKAQTGEVVTFKGGWSVQFSYFIFV